MYFQLGNGFAKKCSKLFFPFPFFIIFAHLTLLWRPRSHYSEVDTFQNNGARNESIENDRKQNDRTGQIYINASQTRSLVGNYKHDCILRGKTFLY